ncbi:hypothetical protein ACIQCR_01370 [Streptomyces sp. NPDC093249]|uniref:hypothetical protein n=1 Tax=unclassified Streptomyces TaxID=2593676 RepID=UPI00344E4FC8
MYTLSIDTSSQSYAAGQAIGALLVTAAVMAVIWFSTRTWRQGPVATGGVEAEEVLSTALRRRNIVTGVLLVVAVTGLVRACTYEGEPPSAAASPVVMERFVDAAPQVGAYRLLTGEEVAAYEKSFRAPQGKRWYYDGPGEGPLGAVLQINTAEWDADLAEEKSADTMAQELRNFFAGAKATEVTDFEAGPWGGRLSCGFVKAATGGRPVVCAWTDSATFGNMLLADEKGLAEAAETALRFRTASEKRA